MSDSMHKSTDSKLIAADKVQGTEVYNSSGEKLGSIKDVYIDKITGKAEFASMAIGGVLGIGEKFHPVPWAQLNYDKRYDGFVVNLERDFLEASPAYEGERLGGDNEDWSTEVNGYYANIAA